MTASDDREPYLAVHVDTGVRSQRRQWLTELEAIDENVRALRAEEHWLWVPVRLAHGWQRSERPRFAPSHRWRDLD